MPVRTVTLATSILICLSTLCHADDRPNVVLVMVDDMGFSDLGCYGGEIETPNLDQLAAEGMRFTQFYNCAKCETTRATLLSGRYYPEVSNRELKNCVTIAEAMKLAGYTTLMTGKWHLTSTPTERGFDRYFGHLSGACNFFKGDNTFRLDDKPFKVPESNFYTTDANTDYAIEFLEKVDQAKPFFLYVAYNAPHYPLHAPKADVMKYRGKYKIGWDELRRRRYKRLKEIGIISADHGLSPRPSNVPAWRTLSEEEQDEQDLMMATFAGMVDHVDQCMGRLIEKLKAMDEYENSLILFLSDNGACPFQRTKKETRAQNLMPWDKESYWTYDQRWAHACNTPFREYKRNQHEGGISTPLIAHWPAGLKAKGTITGQPGHLVDIMATCLDVAEGEYPTEFNGEKVGPARGLSLKPILEGRQRTGHEAIFFSFYGTHNALRVGDWKLVNKDKKPFELYNIAKDRSELHDLAEDEPQRFAELKERWDKLSLEIAGPPKTKTKKNKRQKKSPTKNAS